MSLLRRSPPATQLLRYRRFQAAASQPSSSPPIAAASSIDSDGRRQNLALGSLLRWISGIGAGSALGFLFWSLSNDSGFDFFNSSFLSVAGTTVAVQDRPSRSFFQKLSLPFNSPNFLFGEAFRRKVFFNYEKRIRLMSPPEKVFEYFASCSTPEGELLMTPADLMRAVVPVFPPSESHLVRDGYLRGERSSGDLLCAPSELFMLFDVNNDGHISFKEYIFFVTLLGTPESSFYVAFKMFDINDNGLVLVQ